MIMLTFNEFSHEFCLIACHEVPAFLKNNRYQTPTNPMGAPFQSAFKTGDIAFKWMAERPDILTSFNILMTTQRQGRTNWLDFYPIDQDIEQASQNADKDSVVFIDIGGAVGR